MSLESINEFAEQSWIPSEGYPVSAGNADRDCQSWLQHGQLTAVHFRIKKRVRQHQEGGQETAASCEEVPQANRPVRDRAHDGGG